MDIEIIKTLERLNILLFIPLKTGRQRRQKLSRFNNNRLLISKIQQYFIKHGLDVSNGTHQFF